jgi:hypothetical protein
MNMTLDHSALVDEAAPGMDGDRDRQRAESEPQGFPARAGAPPAPWRRVIDWLFGDRADIDQEGLLAERTLMRAPRRPRRDEPEHGPTGPHEPGDRSA